MNTHTEAVPHEAEPSHRQRFWSMFGLVATCAFLAVIAYGVLLARWTGNAFDKSGPFGDSFAPLNTLFAGLAFAALWASLRMQRQELALQREELRLTRQELAQSVQAQARLASAAELDEALRTRPRVVVTLEYEGSATVLVVRNDGTTPAQNVRLSVDKPIEILPFRAGQKEAHLTDLSLFSGRGHTLAPDANVRFMLRRLDNANWSAIAFEVTAEYQDGNSKRFDDKFPLDSELVLGSRVRRDATEKLVDEIKQLNRSLESIRKSLQK